MESVQMKAPFFVYGNVENWVEYPLPDSIQSIEQLDRFLTAIAGDNKKPFAFKLNAIVATARFHVVNFPFGVKIESPADVNKEQLSLQIQDTEVRLIGFFSTAHKGVFTHHDSNVHIHLITLDRKQMGHLDNLVIGIGARSLKLYLAR